MKSKPIYLDHHATTPVDPRVLEAMLPYLTGRFGNASSRHHSFGWQAEQGVELARRQTAALLSVDPTEVVFTSGATESINLALKGAVEAAGVARPHVVTLATEHKAVLDVCAYLEQAGRASVTLVPVDRLGFAGPERIAAALRPDTVLVSVLYANNEIGTIQPVREIAEVTKKAGVLLHLDAAQAAGKIPMEPGVGELISISGHKLYGPKGVGALVIRRGVRIAPQTHGGGHERGFRSGTLNVPAIVGLGAACEIAAKELPRERARLADLRDWLLAALQQKLEGVILNGPPCESRLPHNLNLRFEGVDAASVMTAVPEIAVSTGSACTSANPKPSHVLEAIGLSRAEALGSLRFGLGRDNTPEEIGETARLLVEAVQSLRELSPAYGL